MTACGNTLRETYNAWTMATDLHITATSVNLLGKITCTAMLFSAPVTHKPRFLSRGLGTSNMLPAHHQRGSLTQGSFFYLDDVRL